FRLYGHSIFRLVLSTGLLLKVCVGVGVSTLLFSVPFWAQRIKPFRWLSSYDGSSRNIQISLVIDGWQWSDLLG
ncbi:MAG: hypothetical protein P5678_25965, partial [Limnospira sp. PMC 1240.20]|nr:hypothetical protein [Limnospira sp. PMC 1238.20]MDT9201453.1 hypothetical protein [Limnospira sp. PMC 1042.18]MDT9221910.1 hypothetical protein [Limnospira sp. PMC 1240.20]